MSHFVDTEFPPVKQSLFMDGNRIKRSNLIHSNGFRQVKKWLRPHEVAVSVEDGFLPVSLFSDPSPKDVIQGELGTCWFLSALALLAEKPFLLLNCMISQVEF
jgi:calpain-15